MAAHSAAHDRQLCPDARAAGRIEAAYRLPKRGVPEPLGMLEQRHRHLHDRRRPLHARLRLLRRHHRQALPAGSRRAGPRAEAAQRLRLRHVVITAVARDDLPDGGADHFRRTIEAVRALSPDTVIEVLTPDFNDARGGHRHRAGRPAAHLQSQPGDRAAAHARRCVPARPTIAPSACWAKPKRSAARHVYTKSGLMLGLGETEEELFDRPGAICAASAATCSPWASIFSRRSSICRWWSS